MQAPLLCHEVDGAHNACGILRGNRTRLTGLQKSCTILSVVSSHAWYLHFVLHTPKFHATAVGKTLQARVRGSVTALGVLSRLQAQWRPSAIVWLENAVMNLIRIRLSGRQKFLLLRPLISHDRLSSLTQQAMGYIQDCETVAVALKGRSDRG